MARRPDEASPFRCRRCGIDVTEWGGICKDCQATLLSMKETDRWRSDYSKPMRRAMSRLIRQDGGAVVPQPRRDRANRGYVTPRRDQIQPFRERLGYTEEASIVTTFTWYPAALAYVEEWGVPREVVEAAASKPVYATLNRESGRDGYRIEDRRRGDVTAVVGFRDDEPAILYVRVHTDQDPGLGAKNAGSNGVSDGPKTMRGVRARIVAEGFTITTSGRHDRVLAPDGTTICTLPSTPGDKRAVPNAWANFRKERDAWRAANPEGEAS